MLGTSPDFGRLTKIRGIDLDLSLIDLIKMNLLKGDVPADQVYTKKLLSYILDNHYEICTGPTWNTRQVA